MLYSMRSSIAIFIQKFFQSKILFLDFFGQKSAILAHWNIYLPLIFPVVQMVSKCSWHEGLCMLKKSRSNGVEIFLWRFFKIWYFLHFCIFLHFNCLKSFKYLIIWFFVLYLMGGNWLFLSSTVSWK